MSEGDEAGLPTPRRRVLLRVVVPVVAVVVLVLGWAGWQLWQLASDLLGLRDVATQAQAHVKAGDLAAVTADLAHAREFAARAQSAANAPAVVWASGVPWIGDDVTVARELAGAADELGRGSAGVGPLLDRVAAGGASSVLAGSQAREVIAQVRTAADGAAARLARLDVSGLALPVGDDVVRLRDGLARVGPAVDALTPYLDAMTILTAPGEKHTWFVVMQNLGESRPSGGMIGSWLLLRTSAGRFEVLDRGSNDDLAAGGDVHYEGFLPPGYEQVFGTTMRDWRSLNMSAHFPDNARLFASAWNARGQQRADGVIALGQGTVRYLAAAAGPVQVDGRTIVPADLADYLSLGVYQDYPDPVAKDDAVAAIVAQIFSRLSGGAFNVPGIIAAAAGDQSGDRLQLWSSDRAVQRRVEAAGISGEFGDEAGPVASVRLANGAANKLDTFVHVGAEYRLGECSVDDGGVATRASTLTVTLRNSVPSGLPDYVTGKGELLDGLTHPVGATRDFVIVHAPVQATITGALVDGKPPLLQMAQVGARPMLVFDVKLDPGAGSTIVITWKEFPTDQDDVAFSLTPQIVFGPLANRADATVVEGTACR